MINGRVTAAREAVLRLRVHGPAGSQKIRAVIDTGFTGHLSLPPVLIVALGLPWRRRSEAVLADGSVNFFDVYEATVIWDRRRRRIPIHEADTEPLVGMALMDGYQLMAEVHARGKVTLRRLT